MSRLANSRHNARTELVSRVRARSDELLEVILARVRDSVGEGLHGQEDADDVEYVTGLRKAVAAAIGHGLTAMEHGGERADSAPTEIIAQARRAARAGVGLDAVLRRYVLGSSLLGDFLMQEADDPDFVGQGGVVRELLSAQAAVLDRLLTVVNREYADELKRAGRAPEQRRCERVLRLLAGEHCDLAEFGYELDVWHMGVIATGSEAESLLSRAALGLGTRLLRLPRGEGTVWGWFGGYRHLSVGDIESALPSDTEVALAVGEPRHGVEGWLLTHRQAQAALRVALHSRRRLTRYADVALLSSVLRDDGLSGSLIDIYLSPLGNRDNGGAVLRGTLRAYFAAERNASSAASALGVSRHTVENRLRTIEEKLGHSLRTRQAELEVALRLEELQGDLPKGEVASGAGRGVPVSRP